MFTDFYFINLTINSYFKMKKIALAILFASASLFSQAQDITAEQVLNKHIEAIGGKTAAEGIKDVSMTMTGEVQGQSLEILTQKKAPNKSLMVGTLGSMGEVTRAICDGTKMSATMMGSSQNAEGNQLTFAVLQSAIVPELEYAKLGVKATLAGKESLEGKDCYKLDLALGDLKWTEYFDILTGLKFRQVITQSTPNGDASIVITYSDYKDAKGVRFANSIKQDTGMFVLDLTTAKIEVNTGLADALFEVK